MAIPIDRSLARPARDEWGVYDPQQAGLAALFARLETKDAPAATVKKADPEAVPERPTPRDAK